MKYSGIHSILLAFVMHATLFSLCFKHNTYSLMYPDSQEYLSIAHNIIDGHGIINSERPSSQLSYRLPGYSLFLAGCLKYTNNSIYTVLWIQIILTSLIPFLIYLLALTLFPGRQHLAYVASLVSSINTGFALYSCMITTESLFMIPWLLFLILFFRIYSGKKNLCLPAGFFLGTASLIRPVGSYVIILTLILLFFTTSSLRNRCITLFGTLFGWLLIIAPWILRNYSLTGALFFHTLPGHHFVQYTASKILMEQNNHIEYKNAQSIALNQWNNLINNKEKLYNYSLNEYEKSIIGEQYVWSLIKKHPWSFIKTSIQEVLKTVFGLYSAQPLYIGSTTWPHYTHTTSVFTKLQRFIFPQVSNFWLIPFVYIDIFMHSILTIGSFFFIGYALFHRSLWWITSITMSFIFLFISITLAYGCARLRLPIEPFLIIMSCWWIQEPNNVP